MMKKSLAFLMLVLVLALACAGASAQTYQFRDQNMKLEMADDYILLTPDNLNMHTEWVNSTGRSKEEIINQWQEEGTLLTAYTNAGDVMITITARQDEMAKTYFDIDQQTDRSRAEWREAMMKGPEVTAAGYTFTAADWKKTNQYGRFLNMKYKLEQDGQSYRGLMRRTVRNGYSICIDYLVSGRAVKNPDVAALDAIMSTLTFTEVLEKPASATPKAEFATLPPAETDSGRFSVTGTCDPGLTITGVVMRMASGSDPLVVSDTADAKGKFSLDVNLPTEGVWLMTAYVENGGETIQEEVFDVTTYQSRLLPVNFSTKVPREITGTDVLTIAGTTIRGVKIQCLVGTDTEKVVTTNGSGAFSLKVDVKQENDYDIVLVFSKKGYDTRRFTYQTTRVKTQADLDNQARTEAIKPAYSTLTEKLTGYTGRIMRYSLYFVEKQQNPDGTYVLKMAMSKTKRGCSNFILVNCAEDPGFALESQHVMYGQCKGSDSIDEDGVMKSYPSFDLLFWDD